jgi:hypothetical protein
MGGRLKKAGKALAKAAGKKMKRGTKGRRRKVGAKRHGAGPGRVVKS